MERSERVKVGLYMMIASVPFLAIGYWMQITYDNFYYFISYGIFALLLAEGGNRFVKNKWGKDEGALVEQTGTLQEQAVPEKQPSTLEVQV